MVRFRVVYDLNSADSYIGNRFVKNLIVATKTLIRVLWERRQTQSDAITIADCIDAVRRNSEESDPVISLDPVSFIYVFVRVLDVFVQKDVIQRHQAAIYEIFGDLSEILTDLDGSSWTHAHKTCVKVICYHLRYAGLADEHLTPKLMILASSWIHDDSMLHSLFPPYLALRHQGPTGEADENEPSEQRVST